MRGAHMLLRQPQNNETISVMIAACAARMEALFMLPADAVRRGVST